MQLRVITYSQPTDAPSPPFFLVHTSFEVSAVSGQSINTDAQLLSFVEMPDIGQNLLSPLIALIHSGIGLEKQLITITNLQMSQKHIIYNHKIIPVPTKVKSRVAEKCLIDSAD